MAVLVRHGRKTHDRDQPNHSGARGHYCTTFDAVWICEDCPEFPVCECTPEQLLELTTIGPLDAVEA